MPSGVVPPAGERVVDLSVVIAAHNEEDHIGSQLTALSRQEWPGHSWEFIVVDNGSTDGTAQVVRSFMRCMPELSLIEARDRQGAAFARNSGAKAGRGRFLAFCDADDVVGQTWLRALGEALEEYEVVTGPLEVTTLNPPWLAATRGNRSPTLDTPRFHGLFAVVPAGNFGVRRSTWDRIGGFDEHATLEDFWLSYRVWLGGIEVRIEPDALVHYRFRADARSLWQQGFAYGRGRVEMSVELRKQGYHPSRLAGWRSWATLILKLPTLVSREGRLAWLWVAANRLGHLAGSIHARSIYV